MKTKTLLIAAVMFLGISVAAFAQAQYAVSSTPVTTAIKTGLAERVGDIGFNTLIYTGPTVTGTITINYGEPVVNIGSIVMGPVAGGIAPVITSAAGEDGKSIVIAIGSRDTAVVTYSFRVTGVRINVNGLSVPAGGLRATITSTGNLIQAGQNEALVLQGTDDAIATFTAIPTVHVNALTGALFAPSTDFISNLTITEKFRAAFSDTDQFVKIELDQCPPAGISLGFPAADNSGIWQFATFAGYNDSQVVNNTSCSTAASRTVFYRKTGVANDAGIDTIVIPVTITVAAPTNTIYPLTLSMKARVTMAPVAVVDNNAAQPRYAQSFVPAPDGWTATLYTFHYSNDSSVLMIPYATSKGDFETGLVIANTTKDPGVAITGMTSPLQQDGLITFYFFNRKYNLKATPDATMDDELNAAPATITVTTAAAGVPTWGLDKTTGFLPAGSTYIATVGELLRAAGFTGDFDGYVIMVCNFSNAHGEYFISDWESFTHGALMLVMDGNRAEGAEAFMH